MKTTHMMLLMRILMQHMWLDGLLPRLAPPLSPCAKLSYSSPMLSTWESHHSLNSCPSTPSSLTRGGLCRRALNKDIRSPCSFSLFPPMCIALSSPRRASMGVLSMLIWLPSVDITVTVDNDYSLRYCIPSPLMRFPTTMPNKGKREEGWER
jgi:hypothetical protein